MKDMRQFERFAIALPARMENIVSKRRHIFNFKTRNISSAGAFIDTTEKFSEGTRFKMDITVPNRKIKKLTGALSLIECEGSVVRSTESGIAVCFNGNCQLLCFKNF